MLLANVLVLNHSSNFHQSFVRPVRGVLLRSGLNFDRLGVLCAHVATFPSFAGEPLNPTKPRVVSTTFFCRPGEGHEHRASMFSMLCSLLNDVVNPAGCVNALQRFGLVGPLLSSDILVFEAFGQFQQYVSLFEHKAFTDRSLTV